MSNKKKTKAKTQPRDYLISWRVPEFETYHRSSKWYIFASIIALLMLYFSYLTENILFAFIVIISAFIIILHDGAKPEMIDFKITGEGLVLGKRFFDYDQIKNFYIIYKPQKEIKNLYFEFKNPLTPRISISLEKQDPLQIRKTLLKYLSEDIEKINPPISEQLAKIFKL